MKLWFIAAVAWLAISAAVGAQPDPRQMSGIPLPAADVAAGTVTVRVLRGGFSNPVASQTVEIIGAPTPKHATTNDVGRAEFTGLPAGARVKAVAVVAGERLESREFAVPATGGIRLMLVGADPGSSPPTPGASARPDAASPAQPGTVTIGDESRFVFEMGEDGLSVFYILQIVNSGSTPINTPVVFDLPNAARDTSILQGSSPQAKIVGRQLSITGPFASGATVVQAAYSLPIRGAELVMEQKLPIALSHLAVVAQKVGEMQLASPQIAEQRTMPAQGNLYIAARGGPMQAGDVLRLTFSGMPHQSTWPRDVAVGLVALILVCGGWLAFRPGVKQTAQSERRAELEATRDRLFDELTSLETAYRAQTIDAERYGERRGELITALERIYGALDEGVALGRAS